MARPTKNTVNYFPHYVHHGKTIFILEKKFGNDGYAFLFKIFEMLGKNENHYIDVRNITEWEYLIAKTGVESEKAKGILDTLSNTGTIDQDLWNEKIIFSKNFIKNLKEVYERRKRKCMQKHDLCKHLHIKCEQKPNKCIQKPSKCIQKQKDKNIKEEYIYLSKKLFRGIIIYNKSIAQKYKITNEEDLENISDKKLNTLIISWADIIRKIIEIDNRTYDQLDFLISFTYGLEYKGKKNIIYNDFWSVKCQSAESIRRNFDKMYSDTKTIISKKIKNQKDDKVADFSHMKI